MIIPDEHTITQLVAAVCGPQTEVDDHQQSIFLPNAISDDAVADWDSESGGSDSLSEIEEHKSMSNIPTPPRDRESHSPDNDHTLAPLVDCSDTATSLFKFLNESNDEIGQLMTQFSPPPTPVSSVTSTTQQCLPMCAKPVATSANTAAIPGVYIMQGHAASLVYVNSFSNAVNPAIATEQEMGIKTEALSPVVNGSQRGRTACPYGQPCGFNKIPKRSGAPLLWQFLLNLLENEQASGLITWTNRCALEFKILDPSEVAKRWGKIKNRPAMNYEKLSRSLRGYYLKGIMEKVVGEQYAYRYKCHPDILCMSAGINETPKVHPLV
jgi:hypothetical protein